MTNKAKDFRKAIQFVLVDATSAFLHKDWEEEGVVYEGCNVFEALACIEMEMNDLIALRNFYNELEYIPDERINYMFSGDVEDLDMQQVKNEIDKKYKEAEKKVKTIIMNAEPGD